MHCIPTLPMDPQVCPPRLTSSQSMINGLDKSPVSTFRPGHSRNSSCGSSKHIKQSRDWEVLEDLNQLDVSSVPGSTLDLSIPGICEGVLLKRRKYPLKGWHKRYFLLEKGILKYSKTHQDIQKGKLHGSLDVSLAVMSINKNSRRIDLDAGDNLYHLKAKNNELFYIWLTKLRAHRVFKKNEAMSIHHGILHALSRAPSSLTLNQQNAAVLPHYASSTSVYHMESSAPRLASQPGAANKVSAWLQQTDDMDATSTELTRCQAELTELAQLIQRLHWLEGGLPVTPTDLEKRISMLNLFLEQPKRGKVFGHSRTLSRVEAMGMLGPYNLSTSSSSGLGASVPSLSGHVYSQLSSPQVTSPEAKKLHQEICTASQKVHASLKSIHELLTLERERVRQAWTAPDLRQNTSQQLASLCSTLSELDLQSRLTKVHSLSLSSDSSEESFCTVRPDQTPSLGRHSERAPSVAESMAEYFDASEMMTWESSSEAEASDESGLSDTTTSNSEPDDRHTTATVNYRASLNSTSDKPGPVPTNTGRRTALPAPGTDNSHIGILAILYNNIGKDLSRVSMPVALNEPLCLMQRVSEELEYPELLDIANRTDDPYERMVYVAAFSISGYAWASWRYRYKPFNPVLGETYESDRVDRGFRYVSEQVSHHPPISACYAESENFVFWQDQRWKNKFWGKSVEIISSGQVNVTLPRYGDHYEWNKAVTCIHNVLSQQRWLEHYGEVVIRNKRSDVCTCKITFVKSNYWGSDGKNEIQGVVLNRAGEVVHRFGGFWHEGIFCDTLPSPKCLWKPNVQPDDHFDFYGFSQYARELNELTPELQAVLPPTDTRFRPDQRLLEQGKVLEADKKKDEVEEKQRERRKAMAKRGEEHEPRFFRKSLDEDGREVWLYNGTYWKLRQDPGFANTKNLELW
ncbi:oxysterol-binding protein-related protein 7-like isoform X2 [Antennarius striatus]|uniref:oxysterol-binding protein-related protein 7-like isoform X2 n=1 Tax=Antennarius striatus TaxID=241820 RepID=UPI0035B01DAD